MKQGLERLDTWIKTLLDNDIEAAIFVHTGFWPSSTERAATVLVQEMRRGTASLRDAIKNIANRHITGGVIRQCNLLGVLYNKRC